MIATWVVAGVLIALGIAAMASITEESAVVVAIVGVFEEGSITAAAVVTFLKGLVAAVFTSLAAAARAICRWVHACP